MKDELQTNTNPQTTYVDIKSPQNVLILLFSHDMFHITQPEGTTGQKKKKKGTFNEIQRTNWMTKVRDNFNKSRPKFIEKKWICDVSTRPSVSLCVLLFR